MRDVRGGADDLARGCRTTLEDVAEALEEVDVLGLLAGELQQGPGAPVVVREVRPRMVEDEREDELLDEAEDREVGVRPDLVQRQRLVLREEVEAGGVRQRLGHERPAEVEAGRPARRMSSIFQLIFCEDARADS